MCEGYIAVIPGTRPDMSTEESDDLHPEAEHEQETSATELAEEDAIESIMSGDGDEDDVEAGSDARPEGSRDLGAGAGATTSDPGRVNPIIPGEGKIEEPT